MGGKNNSNSKLTKAEKLKAAERNLQKSHSADSPADGTCVLCSSEEFFLKYIHLAIDFVLEQYFITGRKLGLILGITPNDFSNNADGFHKIHSGSYTNSEYEKPPPEAQSPWHTYYYGDGANGPFGYRAELTTSFALIKERCVEGYRKGNFDTYFNNFLGQSIAVHVTRTKTFKNENSGNFHCVDTHRVNSPAATEKMAMKIFVYVRMNLNGNQGIYEVKNGQYSDVAIGEEEYRRRKIIKDDQYQDGECQAMPLIPGVYQVHALIEEFGSSFVLKEVYCDGDCIYPI